MAVSVDAGADYILGKLTARKEPGPWEVLLEPWDNGHLPTSTTLEDAIRRRAGEAKPPVVLRGLDVQLRSMPPEGALYLVWGAA